MIANETTAHFIVIRRDFENLEEGRLMRMKFHVRGFPVYLFFTPEKFIDQSDGYKPADKLIDVLKTVENPGNHRNYPGIGPELDPGFPEFCLDDLDPERRAEIYADYPKFEKQSFEFLDTSSNLMGEATWGVLCQMGKLNERYDQWIIAHIDTLAYLYGIESVNARLINSIGLQALAANDSGQTDLFNDAIAKCSLLKDDSLPNRFFLQIICYQRSQNWKAFADVLQAFADTAGFSKQAQDDELNDYCWLFYTDCSDTVQLRRVASLMKQASIAFPCFHYLDTYACLLYRLHDYAEAEVQAQKAIEAGKNEHEDVSTTEDLLEQIREHKTGAQKNKAR